MAAFFDNIEDVQTKFVSTICYYDGKAVIVKNADILEDGKYYLTVSGINGRNKQINLDDPLFKYKDYNMGYVNTHGQAVWFFRRPIKQYRQGLKKEQTGYIKAIPGGLAEGFGFSRPVCQMLENIYPSLEECKVAVHDQDVLSLAFNRDFAVAWDHIHEDYLLEYRGVSIGSGTKSFRVLPSYSHLNDKIKEVIG